MIFNFSRQGTEVPQIPISNDDREILEETEKESVLLEAIEREEEYAI